MRRKTEKNPGFGQRLAAELHRLRLTNRQFAHELGIHENSISNYKYGRVPNQPILLAIAKRLNRPVEWLLYGEGGLQDSRRPREGDRPAAPGDSKVAVLDEWANADDHPGLSAREANLLGRWFAKFPEIKTLLIGWAHARMSGALDGSDAAERLEFDTKARASYILLNVSPANGTDMEEAERG